MNKILIIVLLLIGIQSNAQKRIARNGVITFFSSTPIEDIQAINRNALSIIDLKANKLEISVLIKAFSFKKALMQEHFNENYMESDKYPRATFVGKLLDTIVPEITQNGTFQLNASGDLTIHGVTKPILVPVTLTIVNGIINGKTTFKIKLADYNIAIPKLVKDKIAEEIEINASMKYE